MEKKYKAFTVSYIIGKENLFGISKKFRKRKIEQNKTSKHQHTHKHAQP